MTQQELKEEFRQDMPEEHSMINHNLQSKIDAIPAMGLNELELFKMQTANSLLDNQTKGYVYDKIDAHLAVLKSNVLIESSEGIDFD
jgi:hypothetical protein